MAFVVAIRLASYAVAGAALIITHESTKGAKEKLQQWVVDKFNSWSSDPAPQPPKPCDAGRQTVNEGGDLVDAGTPADIQEPTLSPVTSLVDAGTPADIQEPTLPPVKVTENAVKAYPMAEGDNAVNGVRPAHLEEPTLTAVNVTENAVEGDPTVEQSESDQENAANGDLTAEPLPRHGINSLEATGGHRTVDDVDNAARVGETRAMDESCQTGWDKLAQDAPDPPPPPPPGPRIRGSFIAFAVNAVKNWARSLFNWPTAIIGYVLDPKVRDKINNAVRVGETRAMDRSCKTGWDELAQDAPDPAPPPGSGIRGSFMAAAVNAVKDRTRSLFNSLSAINGNVLDPKVRDKVRRVLMRAAMQVLENVILEPLLFRRHKGSDLYLDLNTC